MAKVVVGMSGGVDSSVTAMLLAEAGHEVLGVTLRLYPGSPDDPPRDAACCSTIDGGPARAAARVLGIPHVVVDAVDAFRAGVVDPFADAYAAGETPSPCIRCNETVKFDVLWRKVEHLGCASLATGHYARLAEVDGRVLPRRAADPAKDQSYFLFSLTQEQLRRTLFPIGHLDKPAVRALAAERGLPNAQRPDSQDVCFLSASGVGGFLARERPAAMRPGPIVDQAGTVLGEHRGIGVYTIGQRHGLGVSVGPEPLFVLRVEAAANTVVVGPRRDLLAAEVLLRDAIWHPAPLPVAGLPCRIRLRYRSPAVLATAFPAEVAGREGRPGARIVLAQPAIRPAPGQAVVAYDLADDLCLGGGWVA